MTARIALREFSLSDDYERVLQLWEAVEKGMNVGRSDTPAELNKKLQRDPDLFLVATKDNDIVGTIIGGFDGRRGMIYHLAVRRELRGQGVGAMLLEEIENRLRAKGCLKCLLHVFADNQEAVQFYRNRGWREQTEDIVFGKELS